eukprot:gb/GECG01003555.1/.p1 GENE.gb/GECG01003555.1/~~gb/GECG01003555.1/.p1  ORF type:complete len:202 (+),score=13.93 gb/GECG01003555.1/:1-606(+)
MDKENQHGTEATASVTSSKLVWGTMLAPQRTLWSTPGVVIEHALSVELLNVTSMDRLADFGCGDGRVLAYAAEKWGCQCRGYEINPTRAEHARTLLAERGISQEQVEICTADILEADFEWPTAIFLYLIPRGLKRVLKRIQETAGASDNVRSRPLRVVTLLYPFPRDIMKPDMIQWVTTPISDHTDEKFKWPLYGRATLHY